MQDTKLFEAILGLAAPWHVSRVSVDTTGERVDVWVEHDRLPAWPRPQCAAAAPGRDHAEGRVWRHLDTCQYQTFLHARVPRVACSTHGVHQVAVPWAVARSRFTLLLERLIIDLILQCSTVTGACRIAGITWDEAWGVMARAVARGRTRKEARPIRYIGVDEKAFRTGQRSHTIVCDLAQATVEYVAEDRRVESLSAYYDQLTEAQRDALAGVAMDMWKPYIQATRTRLPAGDDRIVFDRFHIMREMTNAVDTVRKQEHRAFLQADGASPLTKTKYLWLFNEEHLPARHAEAFAAVQALELTVGRAWAIKEGFRTLWSYRQGAAVRRFFDHWYAWAIRSRLEPVKKVARMIQRHREGSCASSGTRSPTAWPRGSTARL